MKSTWFNGLNISMVGEQDLAAKREKELLDDLTTLESYIKAFWEVLPTPVCVANAAFTILEVGQVFFDFFGYEKDEIIGSSVDILFKNKSALETLLDKLETTRKISNQEVVLKTRQGREATALVFALAREDEEGEVVSYIFSFVDITRIKEERQKAETERDKTLAIIDNFADGLIMVEQGVVVIFNPKAEEIFGIREEKIKGKEILKLEDDIRIGPLVKLVRESGLKMFRRELALREDFILEISAIPVPRGNGREGIMIILHDITREKFIEKMKSEFVSIAAHQLRTPISVIKWILRMVLDGDLGSVADLQKEYLEKAYTSNERMIRLVNDLLDVARIEEGRFLFNFKQEDLVGIVEKNILSFQELVQQKGVEIKFKKPTGKIPSIVIDAGKLSLAVQNLLENAVHYTESGQIIITLRFSKTKERFLFSISDTGIGIPKDQQDRVFNRFFRATNAVKTKTEGTGLGLYIARNIIEAHGGKIWFESEPNKGSAFCFSLPLERGK